MAKKIMVENEVIGKLDRLLVTNKFTQETQKLVTVTLECGDKVNFYENEALFHSVGQYLEQGDKMSFTCDKQKGRDWQSDDGATHTTVTLSGINADSIVVEKGAWSEDAIAGLAGRTAATDEKFKVRAPRDTAPPITGKGAFQQSAPPEGVDVTATETAKDVQAY